jgi:hypothetical protein
MDEKEKITYFAETDARNKRVKFGIKAEDRLRHIYSIGKTGMGKSTMLENMAIQDIQNGEGVAFLDPHGKTADLLLDYIPEHRIKDVIYFAPFDTEFPISFNVMEDVGPDKRHLVVSGLMSAFEKIWEDAWSARMAYILQNTLAALLEYPGATLLGVNRMYADKTYRTKVVENITDPTIKAFWTEEYAKYTDKYTQEATPAIQNKIGQFASNPLVRNIIGQPKSSFDIRKIMDEKKILIVNLSKGLVGENNANLLGSMLVTKIYLAAMSRADADPKELKKLPNFYLYVDEFQSFANKSFADILSEARKYKLSLNITHQYIEQMAEEVRAAVFGNVGTMIAFRVGSFDAEILEKEFAPIFTMEDIVNLGFVQIYLKLMIDGVASQPFSATTLPPFPKPEVSFREEVMAMSRKNFTHPKAEVEKAIGEWHLPDQSAVKPLRTNIPEHREMRSTSTEIKNNDRKERVEPKPEQRFELPKFKEQKEIYKEPQIQKAGPLSKAIEEAFKKQNVGNLAKDEVKKENKPPESKKETMSLQELRDSHKNKNKEPSAGNMNALREALQNIESQKTQNIDEKDASENKKPEKSEKTSDFAKATTDKKEVPEDILRKILKGEPIS